MKSYCEFIIEELKDAFLKTCTIRGWAEGDLCRDEPFPDAIFVDNLEIKEIELTYDGVFWVKYDYPQDLPSCFNPEHLKTIEEAAVAALCEKVQA